ncbi:superoxide dismutase family protein [Mycolicibacterium gadium]|jgi:Cu-Zn family superoxide dismutase|uniref:superoxide dismutase family protein n=1 Tax=Mycolicibacterium gadium TaxID=1794 RepID=UPI002FDCE527
MIKHVTVAIAFLAAPVAVLGGCANQSADDSSTSTTSGSESSAQALTTQLKTAGGEPVADATIDFTDGYATVTVETVGTGVLSPGLHGLHIHAIGTCEGDFTSAGDHFQAPGNTGQPASGDLPSLLVRSDGAGKLVATSDGFTEDQLKDPDGSAIVLHQDATSDQRFACGVLSPASATSTSVSTSTSTSTVTTAPPTTVTETTVTETTSPSPAETTTSVAPGTSTSTVTVIQPPEIPDITVPPVPGTGG